VYRKELGLFRGLFQQGDDGWIIDFSRFLGTMGNIFAELITIYHGLRLAKDTGYARILYYLDSQTIIDLILKDYNTFHYYATVIATIQDMMKKN
jgi:ribonuclease HI